MTAVGACMCWCLTRTLFSPTSPSSSKEKKLPIPAIESQPTQQPITTKNHTKDCVRGTLSIVELSLPQEKLQPLAPRPSLPREAFTMDSSEFRKRGKEMVDYIADYMENIHTKRVLPEVQPGYLRKMLPEKAPKKGEGWEDIMHDVDNCIMPGITHWQHPRFHAYFPAGNSYPSILADMLSDALGCMGFSWAASPACTELETVVLDWLAKMIGLPNVFLHEHGEGGGVIQGSASDCVLVALLAARYRAIKELKRKFAFVEDGVLLSKLVAYCSKQAHSCVEKAGMIGFVKMRELDIDENYSLRGHTIAKAIEEDRKLGLIPFYVCATLGTTTCCSFDSLQEIGPVCVKEGIWLHVDAAYAGSAFICPEFQSYLKGVEHANSLNFNPNKWMLVNFDCSTMWVRDKQALTMALTVDPLYLQHHHADKAVDLRHWSIALSRRFRALKLWFVIRSYGVEGLQKYIREHCRLAKKFEALVRKDVRFEVLGKVVMGLVCFRLKGDNKISIRLLRAINMSGKIHMVPALIDDFYVIRFAVCAQNANDDDISFAWNVVSETATAILEMTDSNKTSEAEELEAEKELEKFETEANEDEDVFLFNNDLPYTNPFHDKNVAMTRYKKRHVLLKMISDPKCYHPKVLKSLCVNNKRHQSESSKYTADEYGDDEDDDADTFYFGTPV